MARIQTSDLAKCSPEPVCEHAPLFALLFKRRVQCPLELWACFVQAAPADQHRTTTIQLAECFLLVVSICDLQFQLLASRAPISIVNQKANKRASRDSSSGREKLAPIHLIRTQLEAICDCFWPLVGTELHTSAQTHFCMENSVGPRVVFFF